MDFFDVIFDSEYRQRADIESLKRHSKARREARRQQSHQIDDQQRRIERLEDHVGELALLCRSLLTILRETAAIDPRRFEEVMHQIDAEDGIIDGKVTPKSDDQPPPTPPDIHAW